jgi:hypothetical protein
VGAFVKRADAHKMSALPFEAPLRQFFGSSLGDRFDQAAGEVIIDALFHFSWKLRQQALPAFQHKF